jgi:branched-chain amino acid transport system substrate-binding protein
MKRGMESIRNFDADGLMAPLTVTAKDHGGGGKTRIDMWDGAKWVPQNDWSAAYVDVVQEIVKKESGEFAKSANQ